MPGKRFSIIFIPKPYSLSDWKNFRWRPSAAGALIKYLNDSQTGAAEQLTRLTSYDSRDFMLIDAHTLRSLEIFESAAGASLLSVIDRTKTAMGGRLLRRWLRQPLLDTAEIYRRQEHVAWFKENPEERRELRAYLCRK